MGQHAARGPWWESLELGPAAARLIAERKPERPADLAWIARAAPDDFKRVFGAEARDDLARRLAARLAADPHDGEGFGDLFAALEEVAGRRPLTPPKPTLPAFGLGAVAPAGPAPRHPLPKIPPLKPPGGSAGRREG